MAKELRIDTEILISLIEENRCIWDTSNENYKDRDMKNKAFEAVAVIVVPDYEKLTEAKKREAVQVVQKRWRTARDAYRRDRNKVANTKSGQAAKKIKTYIFYDNLKFLDQVMELNSTETNLEYANTDVETTRDSSDESENIDPEQPICEVSTISATPKSSRRKKTKQDKTIDDKLISFLGSIKKTDEGGDMAFFESLLPTLQTFDVNQKLQFRSEVLHVMMEIKNVPKFNAVNRNLPQYNFHPSYANLQSYNMYPMQSAPRYEDFGQPQQTHFDQSYSRGSSRTSAPTPSPASSNDTYVQPTLVQLTHTDLEEL